MVNLTKCKHMCRIFILWFALVPFCHAQQPTKIIGLLGQKRVGKDTVADYLVKNHGFIKYSLANPMKESLRILFQFSDAQLYGDQKEDVDPRWGTSPRKLMQFIGVDTLMYRLDEVMPGIQQNFYNKHFEIWQQANQDKSVAVADVRFQADVDAIKRLGGVIVKVTRLGVGGKDQHISETGVTKISDFDYHLANDGSLADLYQKIDDLMQKIS